MRFIFILVFVSASLVRADEPPVGRWEGSILIPGREQKVIVDLAKNNGGAWTGSITLPGLSVKGASLTDIAVKDAELSFAVQSALDARRAGPVTFKGRLTGAEKLAGDFTQGGNTAPFTLTKIGAPQVEALPHSTAIAKAIEGEWKGEYELFGYPRHVTIKLTNQVDGATADFVVVGKKTNNLPVDLVTQEGELLTIDSHETGISYEGRWQKDKDEIKGTFTQGPVELPLVLRRAK